MSERITYKRLYNLLQYLPPTKEGYHWSIDANICGYALVIVKDDGGGQYYTGTTMGARQLWDAIHMLMDMEYNKEKGLMQYEQNEKSCN